MPITIKKIESSDIPLLKKAFYPTVWKTGARYFWKILHEQEREERVVLVAMLDGAIAGFLSVTWESKYPPFAEKSIPEINDLRVLEQFRRKGVATALMDEAEKIIFERSPLAGLGVGLYADYGAAQQMYAKRGYIFDGRGIMHENKPVIPGTPVFVDDELALYMVKARNH